MEDAGFKFKSEYSGALEIQLIERLADLAAGQTYVIGRVDKINGSIKDLYVRSENLKSDLVGHIINCPLKGKVEQINTILIPTIGDIKRITDLNAEIAELHKKVASLELIITEQIAEKKNSEKWRHTLMPIILGIGAALLSTIITLTLIHAPLFVKTEPASQPTQSMPVQPRR
jgi:hypothetical protein